MRVLGWNPHPTENLREAAGQAGWRQHSKETERALCANHWVKLFMLLLTTTYRVDFIFITVLQMWKLRCREIKCLA